MNSVDYLPTITITPTNQQKNNFLLKQNNKFKIHKRMKEMNHNNNNIIQNNIEIHQHLFLQKSNSFVD